MSRTDVRTLRSPSSNQKTLLALGITLALACGTAQAREVDLDIPAQPLSSALRMLGQQADLQILYSPSTVANLRAGAIKGRIDSIDALRRLLQGTTVTYQVEGNVVTLSGGIDDASGAINLGTTSVVATQLGNVTENTGSYTAGTVSVGGKIPASIRETPQSVSVITSQRAEDQGLHNVEQVLKQAPGITLVGGNDNDVQIYSRGFKVSSITTDGGAPAMRDQTTYESLPDMIQYDHVEVLRGSDGMNTGNGEPGGTINLVRKRALDHNQVKLATSAGSWANYRQEVDVTGPLGFDGKLRGRVAAAYEDRDYFYHGSNSQKQSFFGVLEADLTPDTLLTFGGSYEKRDIDGYWDQGLVRSKSGQDLGLSRKTSLAADWSSANNERMEAFTKLEQAFNENWKGELSYTFSKYNTHHDLGQVISAPNLDTGTLANFQRVLRDYESVQNLFAANIQGNFEAFGREHQLVIGADHQNIHRMYDDHSQNTEIIPVDVYNTDIGSIPKGTTPTRLYTFPTWDAKKTGAYVTLKAQVADPLKVIVGARYNDFEDALFSSVPNPDGSTSGYTSGGKDSGNVTYYGGVVYDVDENWSLYTSYSEIYQPQTSMLSASLGPIAPVEGKTYELGVKSSFYDGRLNFSSAVYYVKRENEGVQVGNLSTAANACCYVNGGLIVSRGWDTEISGELLPGWEMSAGYTFNINEYRKSGTASNVGKPLSSQTPKHLFKFFTTYQLPGELERWKVGVGANIQSGNYIQGTIIRDGVSSAYAYEQAGYAVWNGLVEYRIDEHWTAAVNANNLFDKTYYQTVGTTERGNWYGEPRNYMLTLRGTF